MTDVILRTGYDFSQRIRVDLNKLPQNVSGAVIKASLKSFTKTVELIDEVTQSASATGADWANGILVIEFPANKTNLVKTFGPGWIEVAITKDGYTYPANDVAVIVERGFAV